jgi:hypothetical protein
MPSPPEWQQRSDDLTVPTSTVRTSTLDDLMPSPEWQTMVPTVASTTHTFTTPIRMSTLDALMPPDEWLDYAEASYGPVFREESTKAQFVKEVIPSLTSPEATSITWDRISKLCDTITTIQKRFRLVQISLLAFDDEHFLNKRGDPLQLVPKWDPLSNVSHFRPS